MLRKYSSSDEEEAGEEGGESDDGGGSDEGGDEEEEYEATGAAGQMARTAQKFSGDDGSVYYHPDRKTLARDIKELMENKGYTELAKMKAIAEEFERIPNLKHSLGNFGQSNVEYD